MKRLMLLLLQGLCLLAVALPAGSAEMRGLWVDAYHPGFRNPAETSVMVARAKECGFNTLFVQVRRRGNVYYRSKIEPMAKYVAEGYDPLADIVKQAHTAKLQVHAWVTLCEVYNDTQWNKADARQVHLLHPEWLMKDDRGRQKFPGDALYIDPSLPEVREYLSKIVEEIAVNYDTDGIQVDATKFPAREGGYNEASVARFNSATHNTGKPAPDDETWCSWRRTQMSDLMIQARKAAKRAKPDIKFSAVAFANKRESIYNRFQDWEGWLKAGTVDFVVPMVFPSDNAAFQGAAKDVLASGNNNRPVYIGQAGWNMSAENSLYQIQIARELGASGVVVFSYAYCTKPRAGDTVSLMDALKTGLFAPK